MDHEIAQCIYSTSDPKKVKEWCITHKDKIEDLLLLAIKKDNIKSFKTLVFKGNATINESVLIQVGKLGSRQFIDCFINSTDLHTSLNIRCIVSSAAENNRLTLLQYMNQHTRIPISLTSRKKITIEGYLPLLKWLTDNGHVVPCEVILHAAAKHGHLQIVEWLEKDGYLKNIKKKGIFNAAVFSGNLKLMQFLFDRDFDGSEKTFYYALDGYAEKEVFEWLLVDGYIMDANVYQAIGKKGKLTIAMWAIDRCYDDKLFHALVRTAMEEGHLEIIQYAREKGNVDFQDGIEEMAVIYAHIHILKWMKNISYFQIDQDLYYVAAEHGKLEVMEWLYQEKHSIYQIVKSGNRIFSIAAVHGHIEILKWLHMRGFMGNSETYEGAIIGDHLHIIRWLYENRYPLEMSTMVTAVRKGNLDIMDWLLDHKCPCRLLSCFLVANNMDVVHWLQDNKEELVRNKKI